MKAGKTKLLFVAKIDWNIKLLVRKISFLFQIIDTVFAKTYTSDVAEIRDYILQINQRG